MRRAVVKPKKSYFHGNLREAIIKASLRLVEKSGVENLSIREAAKAVGVTHQAPYRHFKDREELLAALAQDGFEKLYLEISRVVSQELEPAEKILLLAEKYLEWAYKNPQHFRLMFSREIPSFDISAGLQAASTKSLDDFLSVVAQVQKAGIIGPGDTRSLARQIWAAMHGVAILFIDKQFKPLGENFELGRQLMRDLIGNLIKGLGKKN